MKKYKNNDCNSHDNSKFYFKFNIMLRKFSYPIGDIFLIYKLNILVNT